MSEIRMIDAAIIGAQKAGTSALVQYLSNHPNIVTHSADREFWYFADPDRHKTNLMKVINERINADDITPDSIILIKNIDISDFPFAIQGLHEHNPDMRLILNLRDPVSRAISGYWYAVQKGWETESIEKAFALEKKRLRSDHFNFRQNAYRYRSDYDRIIKSVIDVFPDNQMLITINEQRKLYPDKFIAQIFDFLRLDHPSMDLATDVAVNKTRYLSPVYNKTFVTLNSLGFINRLTPRFAKDAAKFLLDKMNRQSQRHVAPETPPALLASLTEEFRPMVDLLSNRLNVDLSEIWNNFGVQSQQVIRKS